MKTLGKQFKRLALFLSLLILFQSCVIYKKGNYSLDEAVTSKTKVRLKTNSNVKYKFKRVEMGDDHYYGLKKEKGELVKYTLKSEDIQEIKIKDKTLSTIGNITLGLIGTFLVVGVIFFATYGGWGGGITLTGPLYF